MNIILVVMLIMFGGTLFLTTCTNNLKVMLSGIGVLGIISLIGIVSFSNADLTYEAKQWNGKIEKIQVANLEKTSEKDYYNVVDSEGNSYYCKMNSEDINSENLQIGIANLKASNKYHIYREEKNVAFATK